MRPRPFTNFRSQSNLTLHMNLGFMKMTQKMIKMVYKIPKIKINLVIVIQEMLFELSILQMNKLFKRSLVFVQYHSLC